MANRVSVRFLIGALIGFTLMACSPKVLVDPSPSPSRVTQRKSFAIPRGDGTDQPTQAQMQAFADQILKDVVAGDFPKGVLDDGAFIQAAFVNCDMGIGASGGQPFIIVSSAKQARQAGRAFAKANKLTLVAIASKEVQPGAFIAVLVFASCNGHTGTSGPPK